MLETLCRDLQEQDADVAVVGFRMFEREEELAPAELTVPVQCMTGREAIRSTLVSDELGDFAWNKLYKWELFREVRYPLGRMMEDQGTTYRIFQQCSKVAYRPVPLYYYYQRPDSILHRRNMKFYEDKLDMGYQKYRAIKEAYPGMPENDAAMLSVVEHCYPYLMQDTERRAKMEARSCRSVTGRRQDCSAPRSHAEVSAAQMQPEAVCKTVPAEKRPGGKIREDNLC